MSQTLIYKRTLKQFGTFQHSPSWLNECEICGHDMSDHDGEGCTKELYVHYDGIEIDGQCGCPIRTVPQDKPVMIHGKLLLAIACCAAAFLVGVYLFIVEMFSL